MALFSRSKEKSDKSDKSTKGKAVATKEVKEPVVSGSLPTDRDLDSVIIKPRVTEKAVGKSEQNVYTFMIRRDATKYDVKDAVKAIFGVTPVRVNIVNKSPRQYKSRSKGRTVTEKGMKKAYVYLKEGDHIDLA